MTHVRALLTVISPWYTGTPSRVSLLTSRYPQRQGVLDMARNEAPGLSRRISSEGIDSRLRVERGAVGSEPQCPVDHQVVTVHPGVLERVSADVTYPNGLYAPDGKP